jgi:hypothetical protein
MRSRRGRRLRRCWLMDVGRHACASNNESDQDAVAIAGAASAGSREASGPAARAAGSFVDGEGRGEEEVRAV